MGFITEHWESITSIITLVIGFIGGKVQERRKQK